MQIKLPNIRGKTTRNESAGRALHRVSNGSMDLSRGVQTAVTRLKGLCLNRLTRSQTGRRVFVIYTRRIPAGYSWIKRVDPRVRPVDPYPEIHSEFASVPLQQLESGCKSRPQQYFEGLKRL